MEAVVVVESRGTKFIGLLEVMMVSHMYLRYSDLYSRSRGDADSPVEVGKLQRYQSLWSI
jgi:hypothetical protein